MDKNKLIKGYDISAVQGVNVPFAALVNEGSKFILAKCYEGNRGKDPIYEHNKSGAQAAGLNFGAYSFIYPLPYSSTTDTRSPIWQAQTHFKAVGDNVLVHCIDLEWPDPPHWQKWGCSASQINDWCLKYLEEYARLLGKPPVAYTYPSWANSVHFNHDISKYPLWAASYQPTPYIPAPWNDFVLWQASGGTEKLPNGIAVDVDYAKDLSLWGVQSILPATPPNPILNIPSAPIDVTLPPTPETPLTPVSVPPPAPASQPAISANTIQTILNVIKSILQVLFSTRKL